MTWLGQKQRRMSEEWELKNGTTQKSELATTYNNYYEFIANYCDFILYVRR